MAKNLGNDPVLAPNGIDAAGDILDDSIGAQATTDFILTVENKSATPVANYRVFVNPKAGTGTKVAVSPANLIIPRLDPGETEECHFLVTNPTNAVQTKFTFEVRSSYFAGAITNNYQDFKP